MSTAPSPTRGGTTRHPARVVERELSGLRLHAVWDKYGAGGASKTLGPLGSPVPLVDMHERIAISPGGIVLKGFQAYERAKQQRLFVVECIEYPIAETDALLWILRNSTQGVTLNDFLKIVYALEATKDLQERGRHNQWLGGKQKGLANLPKAQVVNYRQQVADIANVSPRNVGKVQQILTVALPELISALVARRVTIHRAWQWTHNPERQLEFLHFHLCQADIANTVTRLQRQRRRGSFPAPEQCDLGRLGQALCAAASAAKNQVRIGTAPGAGKFILLSKDLYESLLSQGELIP